MTDQLTEYLSDGIRLIEQERDALRAETEALRAENEQLRDCTRRIDAYWQSGIRDCRAEVEASRGLLERLRGMINCTPQNDIDRAGVWISTPHPVIQRIDELLAAAPAPEARQDESLDDRLKQAGMLSVSELLKGAPLDAFIKHAGVNDLPSLLQWEEMRRAECLKMMARYDLGEKDKGDDLYEWTVAHVAAFTELHVNLRAALAEQGERQKPVAWVDLDWIAQASDPCGRRYDYEGG